MLTNTQIHELIRKEGFDIGLTTIAIKIKEKRNKQKEAFIRQEYEYGQRFEYDFGEVKLTIDGKLTKGFLAVLTAPASGFRWAYLYHNSKKDVFLDSQARFFEMIGGCFKEGVYDNMKNVVTRFIGRSEKQLNEDLIKLATYYGFVINVTNCFSGNEKGSVEEAVRFIRNKVFAIKYEFSSFLEAQEHLQNELVKLNKDSLIEEEKKQLSPHRPIYETARITLNNVDKYSFVQVDNNFYSVPDYLVGKNVIIKNYPDIIDIYYKQDKIASHNKIVGKKKTCIDIMHYLDTFTRKPGALRNSAALNSVPELKDIFNNYYKDNPRSFINILKENREKSLEELPILLNPFKEIQDHNNIVNEPDWVESATVKQLKLMASLFVKGQNGNERIIH